MTASATWDGPRWELWGRVDSSGFFRSLAAAFPTATTLFLEGTPSADVDEFLRSAVDPGPYLPDRNTTWPKGNLYRLRFDGPTLASLAELAERHAVPEVLDHLHVYEGDVPLVYWHDAFRSASPLIIAATVDREPLSEFASALGFELWQFPRPDQEQRDARDRFVLLIGILLLVHWAAAIATCFAIGIHQWKQTQDLPRMGGTGIGWGFLCALAVPCGIALLVAAFARPVRAIHGLRWVVYFGLALAWFGPAAVFFGALD